MGGNAIKKVPISRFNLQTYNIIKDSITSFLLSHFKMVKTHQELPDKVTFGDIDFLYLSQESSVSEILTLVQGEFVDSFSMLETGKILTPEIVKNGPTTSIAFGYQNEYYQLDFHRCSTVEEFQSHAFYLSYGDLGGLIGNMTNYGGIKFGGDGLWLYYHPNGVVEANSVRIDLTSQPENICQILGLSYEKYISGFNNVIDMFE
jgi:hypothetical protein